MSLRMRTVVLTVLVAIAGAPVLAQTADGDPIALQRDVLEARIELARLFEPIERVRDRIDRRSIDVGALAFDLAFEDAATIAAVVREHVRFEPYRGVLRGAEGALVSQGANSADLALLLAVLLGDAGYEVELRRAELGDEGVGALLAAVTAGVPRASADVDVEFERVESWFEGEEAALALLDDEHASMEADVARAEQVLAALLVPAAVGDLPTALDEAVRDYFWVAYRLSERDAWTDLHALFDEVPDAFAALEPSERARDTVPAAWTHQISVQAFLERRRGADIEVVALMEPFEAPVANLFGVPLTFATIPDGIERVADVTDLDAVLAATSLFWPTFRGDPPNGAMTFDLLGNTVPPMAASSGFAGVFASSARAMGAGLGALGGIGVGGRDEAAGDIFGLSAVWLDIAFTAPDGVRSEHRRMLVDRRGAEARAAGDPTLAPLDERALLSDLMRSHTLMLDTGRYTDAYVLDRTVAGLLAGRDYRDAAYAATASGATMPPVPQVAQAAEEAMAPLLLLSAMADAPLSADVLSYRPAPGLIVLSAAPESGNETIDVVANPRWSLRADASGAALIPSATFAAGAFETRVEGVVLAGDDEAISPAYELVRSGVPLRVFEPSDTATLAALDLPYESRAAMLDDLARGYRVVTAETLVGDVAGWWRFDPGTGELLGRGGDGRGLAFTEYLIENQIGLYVAAALTGYGVSQCMNISDGFRRACCIVQNLAIGAAGVGLGYGIAAALAQTMYASNAALNVLLFIKLDVQVGLGTTLIPPVCGT